MKKSTVWLLSILGGFALLGLALPSSGSSQAPGQVMPTATEPNYATFSKSDSRGMIFILSGFQGTTPQKNCLYDLGYMQVLQSADGGVLMSPLPESEVPGSPTAFLYTNEEFVDGVHLTGRCGYFVGTKKYTSVIGAEKTVYAFKLVPQRSSGNA